MREEKNPETKRKHPFVRFIVAIVVLLLVIGLLGTILVQTNYKLSKLTAQMTYMQDTVSVINSNVENMEEDFAASLEEQSSLLESYSVTLTDINLKEQTYTVKVAIVPKEYNESTTASVYFGTTEIPLNLAGFYYTAEATLPVDETYAQNMAVLFNDDSHRTTEVISDYTGIDIEGADFVSANAGFTPEFDGEMLKGEGSIDLALKGQNLFQFESAAYQVVLNGETVYQEDLIAGTGEKLPDQSQDTDESSEEETGNGEDSVSLLSGTYDIAYEIPVEEECTVKIELAVTTTEGYKITYDLYSGTITNNPKLTLEDSGSIRYVTFYDLYGGYFTKKIN